MISHSGLRPAVVVIGGSGGIGRAIAGVAAREHGAVVLVARSPEGLAAAASEVREAGGEAFTLELDLVAGDAPTRLEGFLSAHGLVCDVLVNSAGYGLRGAATALPVDGQLGIIDLNIHSLTELTLHFLPGMVARRQGGVLNLSSVAGFLPGPYMALYFASKGFVRFFSEALHQELRRTGVTVTCVAPGPVSTEFLARSGANQTVLFNVLPKVDAEYVAERAWRGFRSGRRLVVPGISAKLAALAASLLPSAALLPLVGRLQRGGNDQCPCGSGMKFKKCCGARQIQLRRGPRGIVP
ncbi:MAG: SDR family NAD(P)-dependent oxidoreductase [Mesorhizobium sp.]|uniref:SDR family NAD(P)-dependent oxidoreductase n=1 Tax=Mesorhizobium sp. TaxID=1871066 RepID=UPI000FE8027A|nr:MULTISPECIES: SDR family NAD(P)-dependent oxidoreductase [Mesorhizobium]MCF6117893.1 SDR family NAD(P)-dependent oxidoreductase [Mesorhizobium muleiense]RWO28893.1 MAG: SDR family NAD(P)-dependent oxidoreductase [Mesorhizobium sp.]RWO93449.1 MAG: SDR family NAD(P)-dependent oxidoreductase [Mesorhizobium sp.]RWP30750.1 MAG: SDR family NAD(P)-dependent oxidoreductase [Mesorhizobium sp.]RWP67360.1 MAG: SDR family NAD(P)-dependent oxidoreductase [Mesorhizobium sp.]